MDIDQMQRVLSIMSRLEKQMTLWDLVVAKHLSWEEKAKMWRPRLGDFAKQHSDLDIAVAVHNVVKLDEWEEEQEEAELAAFERAERRKERKRRREEEKARRQEEKQQRWQMYVKGLFPPFFKMRPPQ
jgi:hypothetical protein